MEYKWIYVVNPSNPPEAGKESAWQSRKELGYWW